MTHERTRGIQLVTKTACQIHASTSNSAGRIRGDVVENELATAVTGTNGKPVTIW
jgi:hypothetical protein